MIALVRFAIAFALSISVSPVFPQQPRAQSSLSEIQSAMLGEWVLTFLNPGSERARLTITRVSQNSDGSFQIVGMYTYGTNQTAALNSGLLTQSGSTSQLTMTTALGSLLVASSREEGGFRGESTHAKLGKNTFKMEKAEDQSVAAAAPSQDSINTPGMAEARQAIERNPVKRPYVEAGDCWTYRWSYPTKKNKPYSDHTVCVTHVDYSKDVIFAVSSMGGDGSDNTYTTEWNPVADSRVVRSKTQFLKFPLHVGDTYAFDVDYQLLKNPEKERTEMWNMKVVGWEDVTVPAGSFRAVRIEGTRLEPRVDASGRLSQPRQSRLTMWYVPEVNRWVKDIREDGAHTYVRELTQYRLNR